MENKSNIATRSKGAVPKTTSNKANIAVKSTASGKSNSQANVQNLNFPVNPTQRSVQNQSKAKTSNEALQSNKAAVVSNNETQTDSATNNNIEEAVGGLNSQMQAQPIRVDESIPMDTEMNGDFVNQNQINNSSIANG